MLVDFNNSFTVGLSSKFATRLVSYFPQHLKYLVKYKRSTIAILLMYLTRCSYKFLICLNKLTVCNVVKGHFRMASLELHTYLNL